MHRRNLLSQLATYAERYTNEAATIERFVEFVQNYENCFERDCWAGHVTGSAWLLDPQETSLLLTQHKKLQMWLQLGGHSDGDADTQRVAMREASEESGLQVELITPEILDIDIHEIPARKSDPAHYHFDVRYAFRGHSRNFAISEESNDLAWVEIENIEAYTQEHSILRMRDKWLSYTTANSALS